MTYIKDKKNIQSTRLPTFNNPPINEVVCGMRFRPLDKLLLPHIGLLWNKFRSEYPRIQHAPPIGEILVDNATGLPIPRVWFINEADDQLIQFQIDRFYFNWRNRGEDYPRYDYIITNFENVLNSILDFFSISDLGEFQPIEYELTYINRIPRGQGWESFDDLSQIFTDFTWNNSADRFLQNPGKVNWTAEFVMPEQKGFLSVNLKHAIRIEDKIPLLVFELKARGNAESKEGEKIRQWFDLAHEWIVRGFTDLTTPEMHKIWEKE